jgi:hypothetical protein
MVRSRYFTLASLVFLSGAVALGGHFGCAPKQPPKQANIPEPADPNSENPADSHAQSSGGTGSSGGSGGGSSGKTAGTGGDPLASPPAGSGKPATGKGGDAPQVTSLSAFTDGIKWGISHAELTKMFTQTGGVIWKDYDEKLAKARVGPEQTALEAEREQVKGAFGRSFIEFKDTPTGYDTTGIRGEFTYKNKESLMWVNRQGKKRYFFFINDKLWKMYDEVPLSDGGPMGKAYLDAVNKLNAQLNAQGRVQGADPAKGVNATTVDWKDGANHLRAVDRSSDKVVGIAIEDSGILSNLAALRPNKMADPTEIDPSIAAVTKGTNRSDPNAAASGSGSAKKAPPPPPKKK